MGFSHSLLAVADIYILRLGLPQVIPVETAVLQDFAVLQPDDRSRRLVDAKLHPAYDILTKIQHRLPRRGMENLYGPHRLLADDRKRKPILQVTQRRSLCHLHGIPAVVAVLCRGPAGDRFVGIVDLAAVNATIQNRGCGAFPAVIGGDHQLRAILQLHTQLRLQIEAVDVAFGVGDRRTHLRRHQIGIHILPCAILGRQVLGIAKAPLCPAVAHHHAQHIVALAQAVGHIVCIDLVPSVHGGAAGGQIRITYRLAVEFCQVEAQADHIQPRLAHTRGKAEAFAEVGILLFILPGCGDPFAQQRFLPLAGLKVIDFRNSGIPAVAPNLHRPVVSGAGLQ